MCYYSLWFAFKLISLSYWIQLLSGMIEGMLVVICFQTYIFVILNTAAVSGLPGYNQLWFAFKLISLSYWIQRCKRGECRCLCCDLLSNLYLCHIEYSYERRGMWTYLVVICFQTYIFVILNTAMFFLTGLIQQLWFAFKLISLSYWIQLDDLPCSSHSRCDLLSNLYLCHIEYSRTSSGGRSPAVVICFQTYIFVILNTAQYQY